MNKSIDQYIKKGGKSSDEIKVNITAPAERFAEALEIVTQVWSDCHPDKKETINIPNRSLKWLIHFDGLEVSIEWMEEENLNSLSQLLKSVNERASNQ
tara:strand:+ start:397 stop:690 length:294 start_codon:yes stop_codon:yes gene_type:complete